MHPLPLILFIKRALEETKSNLFELKCNAFFAIDNMHVNAKIRAFVRGKIETQSDRTTFAVSGHATKPF